MTVRVLGWSGPKGGRIDVGFDDEDFGLQEMQTEIDAMGEAHSNLPDEAPSGTVFVFEKDSTGHLTVRFRVGDTVYRDVAWGSLHPLWDTVHLIDRLLHPERYKSVS
jgi:hypothetical protein